MANWFSKLAVSCLLAIVPGILLSAPVSAHNLANDGNISAFLHISPVDKPQVGKINDIFIYYNDQQFKFSSSLCKCKIKVSEGSKVLYSGTLPAVGTRVGELKIDLPKDNYSYNVLVSGQPINKGSFQPFNLKFDIDLGDPSRAQSGNKQLFIPVASTLVVAGSLKYLPKLRRQSNDKEINHNEQK